MVEAILKDGDRILGEVLTETDSFTVIRSATLGAAADGVRTFDLGGGASTSEVVDEVLRRMAR